MKRDGMALRFVHKTQGMASEVLIHTGKVTLQGSLTLPENPVGLVIFAHGSGSSRHSPRNIRVAQTLNRRGISTLLTDMLTTQEDLVYENRFDMHLLAERLMSITTWCRMNVPDSENIGYFGASTGAAAALIAAAQSNVPVSAVVSRGGRPDLAKAFLSRVNCPVLLIVGSLDTDVLRLNRESYRMLRDNRRLEIIPGATHLFEEPGTLEQVADIAADWFTQHLASANPDPQP
jgi:putative phosphoribosyl transferase